MIVSNTTHFNPFYHRFFNCCIHGGEGAKFCPSPNFNISETANTALMKHSTLMKDLSNLLQTNRAKNIGGYMFNKKLIKICL